MILPEDGIVFVAGPDFKSRISQAQELAAAIEAGFIATLDWRHSGERVCAGVWCAHMRIDGRLYWVLYRAEGQTCVLMNVFQMPAEKKACEARIQTLMEMSGY